MTEYRQVIGHSDGIRGIIPCFKVAAEMLDGGHPGPIEVIVNDLELELSVRVGDKVYHLVDGSLVERRSDS